MDASSAATITNLTTPTNAGDAATKGYVDTADALKVAKAGDTMSGNLAMGGNKVTGLATPTATGDAATKGYVDTSISALLDSAPGALDTLNELAAALGDDPNFATTVTNEIATKVSKAGDTMSGALAMGGNKVTNLGAPTSDNDAATKTYVDTADALKLSLTGGTMSGVIAMGTNKITGVGDPTANQDAATKAYVDTQDALSLLKAGGTMSGAIAMGTNKITGMGDPTNAQDAATKNYIDVLFGSTTSAAASAAAAATSASNAATSASNASTSASNASTSASAAATSATNAANSYDSFDDRYLGAKSSAPSVDNDGDALIIGALYFDTTANEMRVWTGSVWKATGSAVNGTSDRQVYTATASQTTFAITYDVGFVDVYLNGVKQVVGTDFTATSGVDVVLTTGATAGDIVDIVAYGAFNVANTYTQAAADAKFVAQTDIGVTVQAYDATLLNDADIGVTVQAYDATLLNDADIGVTVQAYDANNTTASNTQTLTNKTIEAGTFTNGYTEEVFAISGTTPALSPTDGSIQTWTLSGNSTPTAGTWAAGQSVTLMIDDGSAYTITWTSVGVVWVGGTAPSLATSGFTVLQLWKVGSTIYGVKTGEVA